MAKSKSIKISEKEKKVIKWVVIAIVAFFAWKLIKKLMTGVSSFQNIKLLNPETPPKTISEGEARALISRVITDTYWFSSDSDVYADLQALNDNSLIYTSNIFASQYSDENDGLSLADFILENKIYHTDTIEALTNRLKTLGA